MPYLKAILVNATDKSNRMLRAKAMECISLVGMAVGKEKFRDDAKQVSCKLIKFFLPLVEKRTNYGGNHLLHLRGPEGMGVCMCAHTRISMCQNVCWWPFYCFISGFLQIALF